MKMKRACDEHLLEFRAQEAKNPSKETTVQESDEGFLSGADYCANGMLPVTDIDDTSRRLAR